MRESILDQLDTPKIRAEQEAGIPLDIASLQVLAGKQGIALAGASGHALVTNKLAIVGIYPEGWMWENNSVHIRNIIIGAGFQPPIQKVDVDSYARADRL